MSKASRRDAGVFSVVHRALLWGKRARKTKATCKESMHHMCSAHVVTGALELVSLSPVYRIISMQ